MAGKSSSVFPCTLRSLMDNIRLEGCRSVLLISRWDRRPVRVTCVLTARQADLLIYCTSN